MKTILEGIKNSLRAIAGFLGGCIFGVLVSLVLLHVKVCFAVPLPSLFLVSPLVVTGCGLAGAYFSRTFMWFFLCPLSWIFNADDTGGGHPAGSDDAMGKGFLANAGYLLGVLSLVIGVIFSLPLAVGLGILGIAVFMIVVAWGDSAKPANTPTENDG